MKHIRGFHESGGWTIRHQSGEKGSRPISQSELEHLEDLFVTVADSWDLIPIPTEGYDNKSHFHGDYTMTLDGDANDFVNLEFDTPLEVTPEMESSLKNFLKRLGVYGWSYVPYSEGRECNRIMNTPGVDYDSIPVREWSFAIWKDSPIREGFFDWFKKKPRGFTLQDRMKWVTDIVDKYVTEDLRIRVKTSSMTLWTDIVPEPSFYFNTPIGTHPWIYISIWERKDGVENLIEVAEPYRLGRDAPGDNVTKFQSREIYEKCHELYLKQVNKMRFYMSLLFLINRYDKYDSDFNLENIDPLWEKFNADNREYSFFKYPNTVSLFRTLEYIQDELGITLSNQDKADIKNYLLRRDTLKDLRII